MGRLLLIRHAQASFLSQNYDKLSDLGEKQALLLGKYWARRNIGFDRACTGPGVRHKDTARLARDACLHAGLQLPEPLPPKLLLFDGRGSTPKKTHKVCCRIEATNGAVNAIVKVTSE